LPAFDVNEDTDSQDRGGEQEARLLHRLCQRREPGLRVVLDDVPRLGAGRRNAQAGARNRAFRDAGRLWLQLVSSERSSHNAC